jgi:O-succinylbenzoate synthase
MHEPDDPELPMTDDAAPADETLDEGSLNAAEAEELLAGVPLVPALSGSIPEMKALRARCLAAGIPALIGCPPGAGKG